MKVADLVRSTESINQLCISFIMMNLYELDSETIDKICLALDVEVGDLLVLKKK